MKSFSINYKSTLMVCLIPCYAMCKYFSTNLNLLTSRSNTFINDVYYFLNFLPDYIRRIFV